MELIRDILVAIGGVTVLSAALAVVLLLVPPRRSQPRNHPEAQDDFSVSLKRWSDVQKRKGQ
ncbi:hypothetical protein K3758_07615 [Sulfitobacter sp. W002]|uniref:hypothetical protein n=1 Tax=Sulfitobacter sp. W002 TaxID=2867024 RepID=UPI0021A525B0|nr:hypothetical protein [Sulfitobacter sp. W002]UWR31362.1 hypothetical protein K3758_07615 [Sulfitobacter sp. W002]